MGAAASRSQCVLVGADSLLIECAQVMLDRGHHVVAIVAGSPRVAAWAAARGLLTLAVDDAHSWVDQLAGQDIDYLFAITHLRVLPAAALALPHVMAINFHDGPLPQFAGLNTPVWGLLHGEAEWGVTWHQLTETVDAGDILVQRRFALATRETSLSLNTSNVAHALDSFDELLDLLEAGTLVGRPQDPAAEHGVYRRADRPLGVLDWAQSASGLDRLVRALQFGPHPNQVAAAVMWHPASPVIVESAEVVHLPHGAPPGEVLSADENGFTVACAADAVRLSRFSQLSGAAIDPPAVLAAIGGVGTILPTLTDDDRRLLGRQAAAGQRHENELLHVLRSIEPATVPWPHRRAGEVRTTDPVLPVPTLVTVPVPLTERLRPSQMLTALGVVLSRLHRAGPLHVALATSPAQGAAAELFCAHWPFDIAIAPQLTVAAAETALAARAEQTTARGPWLRDIVARIPELHGRAGLADGLQLPIGVRLDAGHAPLPRSLVAVQPSGDGWELAFDGDALAADDAATFAACLATVGHALARESATVASLPLLEPAAADEVLHRWNRTERAADYAADITELISRQAALTPERAAVSCGQDTVTFADLRSRVHEVARVLRGLGVGPDSLVGVHVERSIDLVVAVLGVLEAGGAYVPLDPAYPQERLRHMIGDSGASIVLCQHRHDGLLPLPDDGVARTIVHVDALPPAHAEFEAFVAAPNDLAYCIYTSGSTGVPKGVLVERGNLANFFSAMDEIVPRSGDDTWFAVTSLSFDISVLELLYTLTRGIRVVVYVADDRASVVAPRVTRGMDFSLFYFSGDEAEDAQAGKYRLLLDGARFADANGFCAVWTPERHFHAFGGLYPNPAITAAAVAAVTERLSVRAGSVVLPLHHPVEIAEAWSVVDNLSNGRVGVAFASGWQPNDFIFRPQNYSRAKDVMFEGIEQIRRLWRGETLTFPGPEEMAIEVATLPRPVQDELPIWITTAGNPETFEQAGAIGANLLTHLLGQSVDQVAPKIAAYRAARAAAGHDPSTGVVTLMLHTFVGDDNAAVRATVRGPLRDYLNTSFNLVREYAWSFPAFHRPDGRTIEHVADLADSDVAGLDRDELDAMLEYAFQRYFDTSGLFGTPERACRMVELLKDAGVDEIACLLDFGVATDTVLAHLPHLARVRELSNAAIVAGSPISHDAGQSLAEQISAAATTHLQCTPSMARMLTLDPASRDSLGGVPNLYVGGEALPPDLARELQQVAGGTVTNMYGPTETTIWSSSWQLRPGLDWVPIGTPVANTQLYVLDGQQQPVPPGATGHLWIGGHGVVRGYHRRPELTAERFAPDPFLGGAHRMYFTGDLARWRRMPDGGAVMEFLGRSDHQVKLRGHRIELGEVESQLHLLPGVAECVAIVRDDNDNDNDMSGDQQLVAYVVAAPGVAVDPVELRESLRTELPEVMVPQHVVLLPAMPRTPNGKLDRSGLPAPHTTKRAGVVTAPTTDSERVVLDAWRTVLGTDEIGVDDNFFDVGGHSLLVVRLHRTLQERLGHPLPLTDLYRYPTVRSFSVSLAESDGEAPIAISNALDRAARRRANMSGRAR